MQLTGLLALLGADGLALLEERSLVLLLPDRVPSKFDWAGHPLVWMPKGTFLAGYLGLVGSMTLISIVIALSVSARREQLKVPNADVWLGPDRLEATVAWLRGFGFWMGALAIGLTVGVADVIGKVGLEDPSVVGRDLPRLLVRFAAAFGVLMAIFFVRFSRPKTL